MARALYQQHNDRTRHTCSRVGPECKVRSRLTTVQAAEPSPLSEGQKDANMFSGSEVGECGTQPCDRR